MGGFDVTGMAAGPLAVPPKVSLRLGTKLSYGLGSIAYGVKDNGFSSLLLLFYNQVIGLPANQVGFAIMVALILDAFIDPVVGHLSDSTRSRWGRRHPFMYAAALPVGLLYLLLWNPPRGSPTETLIYLGGVAILVRTAISCYEVPSSALAPELTSDYHERTSVLGYRYLFGWIGGMGMLLLTFAVFLKPTDEYPVGQLNPAGYQTYAVVAAIVMSTAILISALGTHRRISRLPQLPPTRTTLTGTIRAIVASVRNRAFATLLAAGVFGYTAQGLSFALSTYLNTFFWEFPATVLAIFVAATIAGVIAAFAIATRFSKRLGKRRTAALVTFAYPIIGVAPYMLRLVGWFPANGDPALLPILVFTTFVSTALGVAGGILSSSMMADVAEDAQTRTGKRSEGIFFAGSFFVQKCVSGLGLFIAGAVLGLIHFPDAAAPGNVSNVVLSHLAIVYSVSLVVLASIAALILSRFPLGGEQEHRERVAGLSRKAAQAMPLPGGEPRLQAGSEAMATGRGTSA